MLGTYKEDQKFSVPNWGLSQRKIKRFNDKLKLTLAILISAYLTGFPVARSQAKGIKTKASKKRVQIIRVRYFPSISNIASKVSRTNKVITKNKRDDIKIEMEEVPNTA